MEVWSDLSDIYTCLVASLGGGGLLRHGGYGGLDGEGDGGDDDSFQEL